MQEAWGIVRGVFLYILIGIGVGAFMHGYVPEGFFEQYMSKENWFAVPLSVILAVPMYANAAGIKKVQSAVKLLKNGKSITEVAFHTELPQETVAELAQSISPEVI